MESPFVVKGSATTGFDAAALLWQLNHPKTGENPWFHPLATPSGVEITRNRPRDHPWHRGLRFRYAVVVASEPLGGRMDALYADYAGGHQQAIAAASQAEPP